MGKKIAAVWVSSLWLKICTVCAIGFGIASFIMPPTGEINESVIKFIAEVWCYAALSVLMEGLIKGVDARIKKGDTEVSFNNPDKDKNKE